MEIQDLLSNPDVFDALIKRIADEVIKRLNNRPKKALVLITGGVIGYNQAAQAVAQLVEDGWLIDVFATESAIDIFGVEKLKEDLGVDIILREGEPFDSKAILAEADKVIIAEMTINTAAKVACGIADNLMTTIIRNAIMSGKSIVAAVDGACPDNEVRAEMGMNRGPRAYRDMLHNNLVTLASFEIYLTQAEHLYETVVEDKKVPNVADSTPTQTVEVSKPRSLGKGETRINKHVVSRRDILENRGKNIIQIPSDALLTNSAEDLADELGIAISRR